jgi:hypothetical protein
MYLGVKAAKVLRRAVRFIKRHPEKFNMNDWVCHNARVEGQEPWCGTVACLAGTIAIQALGERPEVEWETPRIALDALGLSSALDALGLSSYHKGRVVQDRLFHIDGWGKFEHLYRHPGVSTPAERAKVRARILGKRVEHFIKTGN